MGFVPKYISVECNWIVRGKIAFKFLDAEKAFDNMSSLSKVLQSMNCETKFLNWIQSINIDQPSKILINGCLTGKKWIQYKESKIL